MTPPRNAARRPAKHAGVVRRDRRRGQQQTYDVRREEDARWQAPGEPIARSMSASEQRLSRRYGAAPVCPRGPAPPRAAPLPAPLEGEPDLSPGFAPAAPRKQQTHREEENGRFVPGQHVAQQIDRSEKRHLFHLAASHSLSASYPSPRSQQPPALHFYANRR